MKRVCCLRTALDGCREMRQLKIHVSPRRTRRARRKKIYSLKVYALYYPDIVSFATFAVNRKLSF